MKRMTIGMILIAGAGLLGSLAVSAAFADDSATTTKDDPAARQLLREASGHRYRWDKSLKGFSADFTLERDGTTAKGTVTINLDSARPDIQVASDDVSAKDAVRERVGISVVHARPNNFDESYAKTTFAIGGTGRHGGTVVKLTGHSIFKDFTVKDGFIIQNHTGTAGFETEVNVEQVAWIAELGKTVPKELSATIVTGEAESKVTQRFRTQEDWSQVEGYWFPSRYRTVTTEGETETESILTLDNIRVEKVPANE